MSCGSGASRVENAIRKRNMAKPPFLQIYGKCALSAISWRTGDVIPLIFRILAEIERKSRQDGMDNYRD
jgi:hypothetical protein